MTIVEHINHGWDGVKRSFRLVWQNKILVMYIITPIALSTLITIFLGRIFNSDFEFGLAATHPIFFVAIALLLFIIFNFAKASGTFHVLAILNEQPTTMSSSIKAAWSKIRYIIMLSVIVQGVLFLPNYGVMKLHECFSSQQIVVFMFFGNALIQFLGFYIIPAIVISNKSFITMVRNSIRYACATWVEIVMGGLILLPLLKIAGIALYIPPVTHDWKINMLIYQCITLPLATLVVLLAQTVLIAYKTIMYVDTYKQRESILPFTQVP